jgi:hypothetical protein
MPLRRPRPSVPRAVRGCSGVPTYFFQMGNIVGGIIGWADGRLGRGNTPRAWISIAAGLVLSALSWWNYADFWKGYSALSGAAIGYAGGLFLRRILFETPHRPS